MAWVRFLVILQVNAEIDLKQNLNTYRAKIRPLSDFVGI